MRWQIAAILIAAMLGALTVGFHGALSTALGGGIGVVAALVFDYAASRGKNAAVDATGIVFKALRAEGAKIGVMIGLLWLVFAIYKDVAKLPFIAAFIVSALMLSMAFFVRDE